MSNYTAQLRYVLESESERKGFPYTGVDDIWGVCSVACDFLFPDDEIFPITEMTDDERFNFKRHFCYHYYTNEIGFETVGLFKFKIHAKLLDIAEEYNKKFAVEHKNLEFFDDYSITRTGNNSNTSNTQYTKTGDTISTHTGTVQDAGTTSSNSTTVSLHSDTPQSSVNISSNDYVSDIDKNTDNTSGTTGNTTTNNLTDTTSYNNYLDETDTTGTNIINETTTGTLGNNNEKYKQYLANIQNIELQLVREFRSLFMQVY